MLNPQIKDAIVFLFYPSQNLYILSILLLSSCSMDSEELHITENQTTYSTSVPFTKNSEMENHLFELVNNHRVAIGKTPFQRYVHADTKAFEHTMYMLEANQLNHDNYSQRTSYFISLGFTGLKENVAMGYQTPESLLNGWLQSEPHKKALESDSFLTGISILRNESGITFFTQLYIK